MYTHSKVILFQLLLFFLVFLKQYSLRIDSDVQLMHPSSVRSIPDMTALGELHECSILRNLFLRYRENNIYVSRWDYSPY